MRSTFARTSLLYRDGDTMLNYRIQPRVLLNVEGAELRLPAVVRVVVGLAPAASLGSGVPGRTLTLGGKTMITWDANTDRHGVASTPPLPSVRVALGTDVGVWDVAGERLQLEARFEGEEQLQEWLGRLLYLLPGLLNVELADPTAIVGVTLESEDGTYRLQYRGGAQRVDRDTSPELQAERIGATLRRLESPRVAQSSRLQAGLHYFHVAARLLTIAESPWEFMPEAVLNMNKVLEVLFASDRICPNSNQQAREELARLGVSERQRETLISVMKLRSHMDVAHVDTWEYPPDSLSGVHDLLRVAEPVMRDVLRTLVEKVDSGEFVLKPDWDSTPNEDVVELLGRLGEMYCLGE